MSFTRRSLFSLLFSATIVLPFAFSSVAQAADKHVAITQIVEHPALDACRKGVKDELAEAGFVVGKNLKWSFESAQGAPATAAEVKCSGINSCKGTSACMTADSACGWSKQL